MKIAMLGQKGIPAHSGGVEQHVEVLSRMLVERGHEVVVYCRRSYCGRDARSTREGGLQRIVRPSIATKHLDAITHTLLGTFDIMLRRADIVHYHALGPAALAPLAQISGLPVVVTCHGLDWQRAKWGRFAKMCLRTAEQVAAGWSRQMVVVSPVLKEYFDREYGIDSQFIPNGVMPIPYRDPAQLSRFGLKPRKYLLAVARLVPEKGLHYLVEAFEQIDTDLKLVIAGGGGLDADYEQKLRAIAGPRVVFTGPADRELLAELYSHAELFVLPSDLEGMSIALLEAMSMGVPVLTSDIPENACVVQGAGFTFRQGDVADLRDRLKELLTDPARLALWGAKAARHVEPFRWPVVVDELEEVYARCCGKPLSRASQETQERTNISAEPPVSALSDAPTEPACQMLVSR